MYTVYFLAILTHTHKNNILWLKSKITWGYFLIVAQPYILFLHSSSSYYYYYYDFFNAHSISDTEGEETKN